MKRVSQEEGKDTKVVRLRHAGVPQMSAWSQQCRRTVRTQLFPKGIQAGSQGWPEVPAGHSPTVLEPSKESTGVAPAVFPISGIK